MISPFLNSRISANHEKVDELLANANGEILIKGIVLYCRISFVLSYWNLQFIKLRKDKGFIIGNVSFLFTMG